MGAHKNFIEYVMPTQLNKPIVVLLMPASLSHADKVLKTNKKGRPAEKPKNAKPITLGLV